MDEILNVYIIFYVNKNGLYDFVHVKSANLKEAVLVSKSYAKASKCKINRSASVRSSDSNERSSFNIT
jgi:hypothetical protein